MTTYVIPILGANTVPDSSGNVTPDLYSRKATNGVWPFLVYVFEDSGTKIGLSGLFRVPKNYDRVAKVWIEWTSAETSGNVVWTFEYRTVSGDDSESMDQAGVLQSSSVTDAAPSAAHRRLSVDIDLTDANFSGDDLVEFTLYRNGANASDTLSGEAILFGLFFSYSDS